MTQSSRPLPTCPVCTTRLMSFCCRSGQIEIFACDECGASLSVPVRAKSDGPGPHQ